MSDQKKGSNDATQLGLPEVVSTTSTQSMDETVRDPAAALDTTAPSLAPVPERPPVTSAPPRTKTGGVRTSETVGDAPRSKSSGAVPRATEQPRRASRVAANVADLTTDPSRKVLRNEPDAARNAPEFSDTTDAPRKNEQTGVTSPSAQKVAPKIEVSMQKVAGITGAVCLVLVLAWVFWPSGTKRPVRVVEEETPTEDPSAPQPIVKAPVKPVAAKAPVKAAPTKPTFALDAKKYVIDPYGAHLEDQPLDPAHKYRLRIDHDDSRVGTALARLDEKNGWGVVRRMASHAALQFGGVKALRMHCEPGSRFNDAQTFPLELTDLATKKSVPIKLSPSLHCWDFEVMRALDLGEGVKKRIRVPTDSTAKLGESVTLKIGYVIEALGDKKEWKTGTLSAGESVLAEGRFVRFGIIDAYAGDNEGSVDLELLSGDTESSGLVTPSTESGAQFVPTTK